MSTILDTIIKQKAIEVANKKKLVTTNQLLNMPRQRGSYSLKHMLLSNNASGIIAEFKRKSPSKNWIKQNADPTLIIPGYQKAGASGLSILTDTEFFGGSLLDIQQVAGIVNIPILRKDFIIDEYQIIEAHRAGADVILLIAANLTPQRVQQLADIATSLGLEVILEVHNTAELQHICSNVTIVGVNNRNLHNFKTNIDTSVQLAPLIPGQFVKISESGIKTASDIKYLQQFGFKGFLIGESFMKTENPGLACTNFINNLK